MRHHSIGHATVPDAHTGNQGSARAFVGANRRLEPSQAPSQGSTPIAQDLVSILMYATRAAKAIACRN